MYAYEPLVVVKDTAEASCNGKLHTWEVTDSQGHDMQCSECGAVWRLLDDPDPLAGLTPEQELHVHNLVEQRGWDIDKALALYR